MLNFVNIGLILAASFTALPVESKKTIYAGYNGLPKWTPTYNMSLSTIAMPCNYSGYFDPNFFAGSGGKNMFGLVDFDWSNAKQIYVNNHPMNCDELLINQVNMIKAVSPDTKVFKYFNFVKALPWYTYVQEKLTDPAYSGWFLKFANGINSTYHSPPCDKSFDPPLCSDYYHDQDQTPAYPHGDGSCAEPCDCAGVPCGEYLFNHANDTLRDFLVNEVILGPTGLGNPNVSGFFLDDGWTNVSAPILPWEPKIGFCDHSPIGGPTEEDFYCVEDMGLTQADTTAIFTGWKTTMQAVYDAIYANGGWAWQMFTESSTPSPSECTNYFRNTALSLNTSAVMFEFTNASHSPVLPAFSQDLATFLLIRGDYAFLGYGWIGCTRDSVPGFGNNWSYPYPNELNYDYGTPLAPYYETIPNTSGIFQRNYTKSTVQFNCNTWTGTITMN